MFKVLIQFLFSIFIMPVKYMREIMENFQVLLITNISMPSHPTISTKYFFLKAFCNQTSLHGWQYITQRPETDGFWAGQSYQYQYQYQEQVRCYYQYQVCPINTNNNTNTNNRSVLAVPITIPIPRTGQSY